MFTPPTTAPPPLADALRRVEALSARHGLGPDALRRVVGLLREAVYRSRHLIRVSRRTGRPWPHAAAHHLQIRHLVDGAYRELERRGLGEPEADALAEALLVVLRAELRAAEAPLRTPHPAQGQGAAPRR